MTYPTTCIFPVHSSVRQLLAQGRKIRPRGMTAMKLDADHIEMLHRVSMEIFVDCTNVGIPFQEAIAAIYLSGLQHGSAIARGEHNGE